MAGQPAARSSAFGSQCFPSNGVRTGIRFPTNRPESPFSTPGKPCYILSHSHTRRLRRKKNPWNADALSAPPVPRPGAAANAPPSRIHANISAQALDSVVATRGPSTRRIGRRIFAAHAPATGAVRSHVPARLLAADSVPCLTIGRQCGPISQQHSNTSCQRRIIATARRIIHLAQAPKSC